MENIEILPPSEDITSIVDYMITSASASPCERSKCASVVVRFDKYIIGAGFNSKPCNIYMGKRTDASPCTKDSLPADFKSDKTCCVHAEQRAIMDALKRDPNNIAGTSIWFLRLDKEGKPEIAGDPYCTICSKMALDVGIKRFVLLQKEGWTSYDTKYYNELSFKHKNHD